MPRVAAACTCRTFRNATDVEIVHGGWESLGETGQAWRDANQMGWNGVLPSYEEAARLRA